MTNENVEIYFTPLRLGNEPKGTGYAPWGRVKIHRGHMTHEDRQRSLGGPANILGRIVNSRGFR